MPPAFPTTASTWWSVLRSFTISTSQRRCTRFAGFSGPMAAPSSSSRCSTTRCFGWAVSSHRRAHTPDESTLSPSRTGLLSVDLPGLQATEREFVTIPVMPLNLILPESARKPLAPRRDSRRSGDAAARQVSVRPQCARTTSSSWSRACQPRVSEPANQFLRAEGWWWSPASLARKSPTVSRGSIIVRRSALGAGP